MRNGTILVRCGPKVCYSLGLIFPARQSFSLLNLVRVLIPEDASSSIDRFPSSWCLKRVETKVKNYSAPLCFLPKKVQTQSKDREAGLYGFSYLVNQREEKDFLVKTASQCLLQYYNDCIYSITHTHTWINRQVKLEAILGYMRPHLKTHVHT